MLSQEVQDALADAPASTEAPAAPESQPSEEKVTPEQPAVPGETPEQAVARKQSVPYHVRWEKQRDKLVRDYDTKFSSYTKTVEQQIAELKKSLETRNAPAEQVDPHTQLMRKQLYGGDEAAAQAYEAYLKGLAPKPVDPDEMYKQFKQRQEQERAQEQAQLEETRQQLSYVLEDIKDAHGDFAQNEFLKWVDDQSALFGAQVKLDKLPQMFEFWKGQQPDLAAQKKALGAKTVPSATPGGATPKPMSKGWGGWRDQL